MASQEELSFVTEGLAKLSAQREALSQEIAQQEVALICFYCVAASPAFDESFFKLCSLINNNIVKHWLLVSAVRGQVCGQPLALLCQRSLLLLYLCCKHELLSLVLENCLSCGRCSLQAQLLGSRDQSMSLSSSMVPMIYCKIFLKKGL